ncbi:MAG: aminotransferase class I/II-fold pyridoxal phosphate-dependent enzyme [Chitinivibrionales bacterium]|nr:aminotransferase class I/II-fold pyridoxal phosphate-dependent enzyme [Chitinivibrionales bacterium]
MHAIKKSNKLANVCYDIRGPVLRKATQLEEEGYRIFKLHIGNPAPFGFDAPEEIIHDVIVNLREAQGYCDSKGLFAARKAVMQDCQKTGIANVEVEDIYIGNGVSELIVLAMNALINNGQEVLIPSPDYPIWTAAVHLSGGKPAYYHCDEAADWAPDLKDIEKNISGKTRAIVVINPNNPTGAVYPREILEGIVELARKHELIVFADEIYDRILYDGAQHIPIASLTDDLFFLSFNGLSKSYRSAGFRAGWMIVSGNKAIATDYIEGLDILASMRLCSNVPAQFGIQTALGGYQSIRDLVRKGGRLYEQRELAYSMLIDIPGISCVKPKGALYLFPKIDVKKFNIRDDQQFVLDLLMQEHVLMVQGSGFNWARPDHFRIVFLPPKEELETSIGRLGHFLSRYSQ